MLHHAGQDLLSHSQQTRLIILTAKPILLRLCNHEGPLMERDLMAGTEARTIGPFL